MRVLVVDDEAAVREALDRALRLGGFHVSLAADRDEALHELQYRSPDVVVLDVRMPGVDGVSLCRELRNAGNRVPILMLTARDAVADRVGGLEAGADDYLVKPFALEELLARLRALLRRVDHDEPPLYFCDLVLDPATREANRGGRRIELSKTEYDLLHLLMRNPRHVLTRSVIYEAVWGYDPGLTSNSIEVYIGYLRKKTEAENDERIIHTVRGVGYVLREP